LLAEHGAQAAPNAHPALVPELAKVLPFTGVALLSRPGITR
jgi:hypothetical protein